MKKFIAYFDFLGFGQFIENNDFEYQMKIIEHVILRDIEFILSENRGIFKDNRRVADLQFSDINCINFSDTIVLWTNDDTDESLKTMLKVAHNINWKFTRFSFPLRGCLVYDEIQDINYRHENMKNNVYNVNSLYGKGLVRAHKKAEKQQWSGTVIDETVIQEIENRQHIADDLLKPYAIKYKVPYKNNECFPDEYVFNLINPCNSNTAYNNWKENIVNNFSAHKKSVNTDDVRQKLNNTLQFLQVLCQTSVESAQDENGNTIII